jgi:membrane protease YdiL (CAAX protease family)
VELALVLGLLELDLWCVRVLESGVCRAGIYLAIACLFLISWKRRRRDDRQVAAAPRAWLFSLSATAGLALALMIGAYLAREPYEQCWLGMARRRPGELAVWLAFKAAVVCGQQIGLQLFLWPLCLVVLRRRVAAAVVAAAVFGLLHLPSTTLVAITALAALVWVWVYESTGRLLPLVAAHLLLGVLAHGLLPERLIYDMRVGSQAMALLERRHLAYRHETRVMLRLLTAPAYYSGHGGTDPGFIKGLYADVLGRSPAPWEVELWLANLRRLSRAEVAEQFLICEEAQERQAPSHSRAGRHPPLRDQLPALHLLKGPWEAGPVYRESVLFVQGEEEIPGAKLLFDAAQIMAVQRADAELAFEPAKDYQLSPDGSTLYLPRGSRIPFRKQADFFLPKRARPSIGHQVGHPESGLLFGEGPFFHELQVEVTYLPRAGAKWVGYRPAFALQQLPATIDRLRNKKSLTVAVCGDSISRGYNTSGDGRADGPREPLHDQPGPGRPCLRHERRPEPQPW